MRRGASILLWGLALALCPLLAAPPELTGVGGDGRIDALAQRPWWSHTELLIIIGVLFGILATSIIWNRSIQAISSRRARRLAQEEIAHARTRLKVEERTELAVEIHDALSQTLTGIALQLEAALDIGRQAPERAERCLTTASQMLASCRHELRGCLWDLRTRTFEERDLTEALTQTLAPNLTGIQTHVHFSVPRSRLSESTVHTILKIVRELAVNALRHGHAHSIRIVGEMTDGTIHFSVSDDGCGFDVAAVPGPRDGHFGLQGIRERLRKYGGTMTIDTTASGTRVAVSMPHVLEREEGT